MLNFNETGLRIFENFEVDENCNLTLEDFIDKFGKEAILKNNITSKIDIQNIAI